MPRLGLNLNCLDWVQATLKIIKRTANQPLTLNSQHSTLNPHPSTLNSQPSAFNPQPSDLNPQPSTLNPQIPAHNPQPSTLNPHPATLNPQPPPLNPQPPTPNPQPSFTRYHSVEENFKKQLATKTRVSHARPLVGVFKSQFSRDLVIFWR